MYFVTVLNQVLQQSSTAGLAKTKADIAKRVLIPTRLVGDNSYITFIGWKLKFGETLGELCVCTVKRSIKGKRGTC